MDLWIYGIYGIFGFFQRLKAPIQNQHENHHEIFISEILRKSREVHLSTACAGACVLVGVESPGLPRITTTLSDATWCVKKKLQ